MKRRYFYMKDIECTIKVEEITRKEMLSWLDDFTKCVLENNYYKSRFYYVEDDVYEILYKDGTTDYIDENYDGHKIRKQNIAAIVNSNAESYMTYGKYEVSETGAVYAAFEEKIDDTNIIEVDRFIA